MEPEAILWLLQLVCGNVENLTYFVAPKDKIHDRTADTTAEGCMKNS